MATLRSERERVEELEQHEAAARYVCALAKQDKVERDMAILARRVNGDPSLLIDSGYGDLAFKLVEEVIKARAERAQAVEEFLRVTGRKGL